MIRLKLILNKTNTKFDIKRSSFKNKLNHKIGFVNTKQKKFFLKIFLLLLHLKTNIVLSKGLQYLIFYILKYKV